MSNSRAVSDQEAVFLAIDHGSFDVWGHHCEDYIFTDTLGYKYITEHINMLRIKLEDLLLFLVLMRLAPWISFYPSRILSLHPLRILGL